MDNPWIAAVSALFLWWFSTGLILWRVRAADNGPAGQHLLSVIYALPLLVAGGIGITLTSDDASSTGAYLAFLSALGLWGWIELAFLSGIITGPNRRPCPKGVPLWDRFVRGVGTLAWHELLLIATLVALGWATEGRANPVGFWAFAVLFFCRISAKLNLFFGVPRIHTEFLTRPLAHLPSHFRRAHLNAFFPLSVSILTFATYCWLERLGQATEPGAITGFALLSSLSALALLEHWFMVLPLPDQKLWRWMMPAPKPMPKD